MLPCLSSRCSSSTNTPMQPRNELNDVTPPNAKNRSLLVDLSARVLGSIGLGLSILAIWVRWLVPSDKLRALAPAIFAEAPSRSRRRPSFPLPVPVGPPIRIIGDGNNALESPNRGKRVYFADTPISQRNSPSVVQPEIVYQAIPPALPTPPEESPRYSFSSSSFVATPPLDGFQRQDSYEESVADSDTSSRRSSLSCRVPKFTSPFGSKTHDSLADIERVPASSRRSSLDDSKPVRRYSVGLTPAWTLRNRRNPESQQEGTTTTSRLLFHRPSTSPGFKSMPSDPVQSSLNGYFSLKPQRRTSTPVPRTRTQPYDAPYFATPPLTDDIADIRRSPRILQEALLNSSRKAQAKQMNGKDEGRGRQLNLQPKVGLCKGRTLPRRRSASESWINKQRTI